MLKLFNTSLTNSPFFGMSFIFVLVFSYSAKGQNIAVIWMDDPIKVPKDIRKEIERLPNLDLDSLTFFTRVSKQEQLLQSEGFLTARLTTSGQNTITATVGEKFSWKSLDVSALPKRLLDQWGVGAQNWQGDFHKNQVVQLVTEVLRFHEDNGYPFARLTFDSLRFENPGEIAATLRLTKGPFITIDSIAFKGYSKMSNALLKTELGIKLGMTYSEKQIQGLTEKMGAIEHVKMTRAPQVLFQEGKTTLFLYLEEEKSNQFDGIIGVNTREDGRVTFNGDFNLRLLNTFKTGEDFTINWRSPDEAVQQFQLHLNTPYLFKTPFLVDVDFQLFRQDSSWANRDFQLGVGYAIASGTNISVGLQTKSSNVLSGNQNAALSSISQRSFFTQARLNKVNHPLLPTKGYRLTAKLSQGNRQRSDQQFSVIGVEMELQYFFKLSNQSHLYTKGLLQSIRTEELNTNELFRVGGLKTLRGFNELSLFSSTALLGTIEYRFFLERFSYLFAFIDGGQLENATSTTETTNLLPIGTGAGFSFRTGGGIFTLAFAVGRTNQSPFDFRTSKVHVGFTNRF